MPTLRKSILYSRSIVGFSLDPVPLFGKCLFWVRCVDALCRLGFRRKIIPRVWARCSGMVFAIGSWVARRSVAVVGRRCMSSPAAGLVPEAAVTARVLDVVQGLKWAPESVAVDAHFVNDLEFDSLIQKDLIEKLGAEFCVSIPHKDAKGIVTVKAAVDFFAAHPKAR
jgi:acyl carrier protein